MYHYLEGKLVEVNPAYAVIDCGGVGFFVHISLNTFVDIKDLKVVKLLVHQVIREDAHLLFGFYTEVEKKIFVLLLSVSGVGANTARMILSSMNPNEISQAILLEDVKRIQGVKGIGAKSAQRIIVDLKDKVGKENFIVPGTLSLSPSDPAKQEAMSALIMLGFPKNNVEKVLEKIEKENPNLNSEGFIKMALKMI